jgi:succinylarginine dihydrolase
MKVYEVNFDGLIGPTHNYSGLSYGNIASISNQGIVSSPQDAALQGLNKMKFLHDLGIKQGILPPHERPHIDTLKRLGINGSLSDILKEASEKHPHLFACISSSAAMWTANAATITPSTDSFDGKVHFTAANLSSKFHRSIEAPITSKVLQHIFADSALFTHHTPLPSGSAFSDEGAANHIRFCEHHNSPGYHLFVYGREGFNDHSKNLKFPARQTFEASSAISRLHQIHSQNVFFAKQSKEAIDAGVFHNDVISTGNENLFLYHEQSFENKDLIIGELKKAIPFPMHFIKVLEKEISLKDSVSSYLFNSQLVTLKNNTMALIAPMQCKNNLSVKRFLDGFDKSLISEIHYLDLTQSMLNGGGPACLRLRIVLNENELKATNQAILFDDKLYAVLTEWVKKHYRDRLSQKDLADIQLLDENYQALDELTTILNLGSIYDFQKIR